ncbi:MAG: pyridoxal phosphate-dependent aminotransferase [Gemmatimonadota bacterium]|nr:pyridoxal phosphate-dependent aminotransferase [Gemmatimonadota bacterium]
MSDREAVRAPYMHWSKTHPPAPHELTGSNLSPVALAELPRARDTLALSGPNDEGYTPFVGAIAARYGVEATRVCTATGTSGANFLAMAAVLRAGDEVLIECPAYDPILGIAEMLGARALRFDRRFDRGFQPDPDEIEAAMTPRTRLIVLTNLHNPSGVALSSETLAEIGRRADAAGAKVLVDEVYRECAFEATPPLAASLGDTFISTNSLTKSWGLAGLRAGWVIASHDVAEGARRARDVVDAVGSFPSEVLATLALEQAEKLLERSRSILLRNSRLLADLMSDAAVDDIVDWVRPPAGSPVAFPRLLGTDDAGRFVKWLHDGFGVGVVPGRFFQTPAHFRVAVGGEPSAVEPALDALREGLFAWRDR